MLDDNYIRSKTKTADTDYAVRFSGVDEFASFPNSADYSFGSGFTISAFARILNFGITSTLFNKQSIAAEVSVGVSMYTIVSAGMPSLVVVYRGSENSSHGVLRVTNINTDTLLWNNYTLIAPDYNVNNWEILINSTKQNWTYFTRQETVLGSLDNEYDIYIGRRRGGAAPVAQSFQNQTRWINRGLTSQEAASITSNPLNLPASISQDEVLFDTSFDNISGSAICYTRKGLLLNDGQLIGYTTGETNFDAYKTVSTAAWWPYSKTI